MFFDDIVIGQVERSAEFTADRDDMIAYAVANDPWPIHTDEAAASAGPTGGLIASFGYVVSLIFRAIHTLPINSGPQEGFAGALEWRVRFHQAVRPGDRLHVDMAVLDKKLGRRGNRGVVTSRCDLVDQEDVTKVSIEITSLYLCRPSPELDTRDEQPDSHDD